MNTALKVKDEDVTSHPMIENAIMDRDYILICKGLWKFFYMIYGGIEIKRYAIERDKIGRLYRNVQLPSIKVAVMRRGDRLKQPKLVIGNHRTSVADFKQSLKNIFYVLQDADVNALRDIRIWIINPEKMSIDEFQDSYNKGIADNLLHSFDFPGCIVLDKYPVQIPPGMSTVGLADKVP